MSDQDHLSMKDLSTLLKGWLMDTVYQELEKNRRPAAKEGEGLGAMLQPSDDGARKVRARRFREALAGLETMLIGQDQIEYRPVLDHILHNIGASLQGLDMLVPEAGLVEGPQLDYRALSAFPAMVAPRRYVAMPLLTQAMGQMGFGHSWLPGTTVYLVEYREWQPRLLRRPAHDDERFGLFTWSSLYAKDICFLPMSRVPGSRPLGLNELVVLGQRTSLLGRLFDSNPHPEEDIFRLSAREFTLLLRALLLDYETHHTARQREAAERDQLGAMLWDFMAREDE